MPSQSTTEDCCREALRDVEDPELPLSLVDLGLIYDVNATNGHVEIEMTLTAMGCPAAEMIKHDIKEQVVESVDDVETVDVEIVWDPVWTKDRISDEGKQKLRSLGIGV